MVTNILTRNYHEFLHFLIFSQYIIQSMELKKLNVTESKIKRIVGHKSLDVTDGVYTHYSPQDLLIEVKKLDYGD